MSQERATAVLSSTSSSLSHTVHAGHCLLRVCHLSIVRWERGREGESERVSGEREWGEMGRVIALTFVLVLHRPLTT